MSTLPMGNGIAQLLQALTGREGYDMRQAERSVNEQQDRRDAIAGFPPRYEYGDVRTARDDVDYARDNSQVNWRTAGQGGLVGLIGSLVNARNARKMGEQARGDLSKAMKDQERQRMEYYKNMPPAPEAKPSAFGEKWNKLEEMRNGGKISEEQYQDASLRLLGGGGQSITVNNPGQEEPSAAWEVFQKEAFNQLEEFRQQSRDAERSLSAASDMRKILEDYDGGLTENALGLLGRFMPKGTDMRELAANRELFELASSQTLKQALEKMRGLGQMTEKEFEAATREMARFSNTREANLYAIDLIEKYAGRGVSAYSDAVRYMQDPSSGFGRTGFAYFNPDFTIDAPASSGSSGTIDISNLSDASDEEIAAAIAELERRK